MKWFRRIALSLGIIVIMAFALAAHYYYKGFYRPSHTRHRPTSSLVAEEEQDRLHRQAALGRAFLDRHDFNIHLCFLVDMRLPSGKNRFFAYDLDRDSILLAGLVAHGCGSRDLSVSPSFSNINGSSCTALGRYRIGYRYQGQFGRAYKLYGLDSTNDQAFNRNIVLHAYTAVPAAETDPYPICNSRGCPMVAPSFLGQLQPFIDHSRRPVLLWIFD